MGADLRLKRNPKGEKVYQGLYEYRWGEKPYSEEEFIVFRDNSGLSLSFFSQMDCRVATGEILRIYVDYVVSKDYLPQKVLVEKNLGERHSSEIYQYNKVKSCINYFFIAHEEKKHLEIPITSRFHITTPTVATSMLFLKSRLDNIAGKNFHTLFACQNQWDFSSPPQSKSVVVQQPGNGTVGFKVGDEVVSAPVYNLYENIDDGIISSKMPYVEVYMSRHLNLPYVLKSKDGMRIEMKKFENLGKD